MNELFAVGERSERFRLKRAVLFCWSIVILVSIVAGCASGDTGQGDLDPPSESPSAETTKVVFDDLIVTTRIMALVTGVLVEHDGCLRIVPDAYPDSLSEAIVWQKDVFEITRAGDEVHIIDLELADSDTPVVWKIGERIRTSGGQYRGREDHASSEFLQRCEGPYVFVSSAPRDSEPVLTP
ncbi:MAG: hypothetical protein HQ478_00920 [Chloroflexi bacterium]|nr:hypothetical protein [Chloroflexota bacterium]